MKITHFLNFWPPPSPSSPILLNRLMEWHHLFASPPLGKNPKIIPINNASFKTFNWIPLAAIVVINVIRGAGIEPVLHILTNEMFPMEIRTLSIGITQSAFLISGFVSVKIFPTLENAIGLGHVCVIYSSICFLVILWGSFTIPDNRGKSLVKVEENTRKITSGSRNIMMSTVINGVGK